MIFSRRIQLLVFLFDSVGSSVTLPYLYRIYSYLWSLADMHKVTENLNCSTQMFPAEVEDGSPLSCFSSVSVNRCLFCRLFNAMLFCIFMLFVGDFTV